MALQTRDFDDLSDSHSGLLFGFFVLFMFACLTSVIMLYMRRKRQTALHLAMLPTSHRRGHQRSLTITSTPTYIGPERVYVYDDKMNLISKPPGRPDSPLPEIRITFPDEVDRQSGRTMAGKVVVVRIADSGSIGMEPLHHEQLPPYQQADAGRLQSLDLNRMGGLREGQQSSQPRWS